MAPSLASMLAAKVSHKRKEREGLHGVTMQEKQRKTQDSLARFDSMDTAMLKQLITKGTKTSIRKLRKLGLLTAGGETLEQLKESFEAYVAEGEEAAVDNGKHDEDIEGAMIDASKAYESLVVSLAANSKDKVLRGGVLETYGREGQRALMMDERQSDNSEDSEDIDSSNEYYEEDDTSTSAEEDVGTRAPKKGKGTAAAIQESLEQKDQMHVLTAKSRKMLQKRNFFREHLDLSVDALEVDTSLAAKRKELHVVECEGMQAWATRSSSGVTSKSSTLLLASEGSACPDGVSDKLADYGVKARVVTRWNAVHENDKKSREFGEFQSHRQAVLFGIMNSYMDMLYPLHRYPNEVGAIDPVMDATLLHIINHIVVSGDVIKKNNELLERTRKDASRGGRGSVEDNAEEVVCQDQGFVRPKVLILAPFRHHAKRIVERLIQLAIQETRTDTVKNKARFEEEFGVDGEDELVSERERVAMSLKPNQHRALFDGNCDDHFRLGIKMTRGSIRLFTDFYDSDILVASPLALSTRLEETKKDEPDPKDFLSSIEISILYRADALLMQNMAHVIKIYESLNNIPKQQHNSDILRVRDWYLGARAGAYRQNILLSSFESPEMKSLFSRFCLNHAGIMRWRVAHRGVLGNVSPGIKHVFERLEFHLNDKNKVRPKYAEKIVDVKDEADVRFEHFTTQVWPKIRESSGGQLLFIPSYFDLVRLRNYLRKEAASFVLLSEYTTPQDMSRARSYFNDGRRRVLVYTERCHFYNRHRIRGIRDIYFYQLPEHPQYYAELANFIDHDAAMSTIHVLYTVRDVMRLERVVGTTRAKKMLGGGNGANTDKKKNAGTFVFC